MNKYTVIVAATISLSNIASASINNAPVIEQGIFKPAPPMESIKETFYVREVERPLLPQITAASNSIARFLIDTTTGPASRPHDAKRELRETVTVDPRPPPIASSDGKRRYVPSSVYCWKNDGKDHLKFLVEWGDITTSARYTDSYVFIRKGTTWSFEKHGNLPPYHWEQTAIYFQRPCPMH